MQTMNQAEVIKREGKLFMTAKASTNLFNSMLGSYRCHNFPYYYTQCTGDFLIRCQVAVDFQAVYDLGCIVVYEDAEKWMKLAFENSDAGGPAIVSIVTGGTSDDCNGAAIPGESVWLQVCRKGDAFAMHHSQDGIHWSMVRVFRLNMAESVKVGLSVQCPSGESCTAVFQGLEIAENPYDNIRLARSSARD